MNETLDETEVASERLLLTQKFEFFDVFQNLFFSMKCLRPTVSGVAFAANVSVTSARKTDETCRFSSSPTLRSLEMRF